MASDARRARGRKARADGRRAELIALWLLRLKGYRLEARNLRTPVGEIDLLMRRGGVVAVVEVKRRGTSPAAEAISHAQRGRLLRASQWALAARPHLAQLQIRFDVVLLESRRWPRHLQDAWRA
jgi:putative endonuclease